MTTPVSSVCGFCGDPCGSNANKPSELLNGVIIRYHVGCWDKELASRVAAAPQPVIALPPPSVPPQAVAPWTPRKKRTKPARCGAPMVTTIPTTLYLEIVHLLGGRMKPARWLGLVVAQRLEDEERVPRLQLSLARRRVDSTRIAAHGNGTIITAVYARVRKDRHPSLSAWLAAVATEAFHLKRRPKEPPFVSVAPRFRKASRGDTELLALRRELRQLQERLKKKRAEVVALLLQRTQQKEEAHAARTDQPGPQDPGASRCASDGPRH